MAQYIPKSALVAEITHKIKVLEAFVKNFDGISDKVEKAKNKIEALGDALLFIENLEVKEVDLENEVESYWKQCDMTWCRDAYSMTHIRSMLSDIAKHFYKLGISINHPITSADRGMAEEIIINLKRVEQDYRINLTREIEWLRNKVQEGE